MPRALAREAPRAPRAVVAIAAAVAGLGGLAGLAGTARADAGVGIAGAAEPAPPSDLLGRPLVLARGQVELALVTEVALGSFARPLSFAPDGWWGVSERWTVGIIHSDPSLDQIDPGASFCVRMLDPACDRPYRGGGIDVRWSARTGDLAVAPRARLLVRDFAPVQPAVALGALVRWRRGRFAITGDPYLRVGLANTGKGNRAALVLPVAFAVQPAHRWSLAFETGWNSDLAVWRDGWHVPAAVDVRARATDHLDVGGTLGFSSLLGPQATANERVAFVTLAWRS